MRTHSKKNVDAEHIATRCAESDVHSFYSHIADAELSIVTEQWIFHQSWQHELRDVYNMMYVFGSRKGVVTSWQHDHASVRMQTLS